MRHLVKLLLVWGAPGRCGGGKRPRKGREHDASESSRRRQNAEPLTQRSCRSMTPKCNMDQVNRRTLVKTLQQKMTQNEGKKTKEKWRKLRRNQRTEITTKHNKIRNYMESSPLRLEKRRSTGERGRSRWAKIRGSGKKRRYSDLLPKGTTPREQSTRGTRLGGGIDGYYDAGATRW